MPLFVDSTHILQELIQNIADGVIDEADMLAALCGDDAVDRDMVCFLRAITAMQLECNRDQYDVFIPGVDEYVAR